MTDLTKIILNIETFPQVEIDFMNNIHYEEIKMVNELGELITAYQEGDSLKNGIEKITYLLENWLQHTQAHFEREDVLMMDIEFPMYLAHSGEHERVLEEMSQIVTSWQSNHDIELLANYVFIVWPEWFDGHVNSMDMMTAQFAVMTGYDPHSQPPEE